MKILSVATLIALMLGSVVPAAAAENKPREAGVLKFEEEWAQAMIKADLTALARLQGDDFVSIDPGGTIANKTEDLAQYGPGKLKLTSLKLSAAKIRFYGSNTAVVTGTTECKGTFGTTDISGVYAFTDVLRLTDSAWQVVSTQVTKVESPK